MFVFKFAFAKFQVGNLFASPHHTNKKFNT
jgi:hypothetical protein